MTDIQAMRRWVEAAKKDLAAIEQRAFAIVRRRQIYILEGGEERRRHAVPPTCHDCPQNRRKG